MWFHVVPHRSTWKNEQKNIIPCGTTWNFALPRGATWNMWGSVKYWKQGDARARTRIELAIGDSEMIHISGANTAREMWEQLKTVKESRGRLGILATRRALYRATAANDFNMVDHISIYENYRRNYI